MLNQLLVVPLCMEWLILITVLAPNALANRKWVLKKPGLGIFLWLFLLISARFAFLIAFSVAVVNVFRIWFELESQPLGSAGWFGAALASFAPWLFLALAGISLALMGQVVEPQLQRAKVQQTQLDLLPRPSMFFGGVGVCVIELPIPAAFVTRSRGSWVIVISSVTQSLLGSEELEAVLWHELGHIKYRHNALKKLVNVLNLLTPWFAVTQELSSQVSTLTEIQADNFALRSCQAQHLQAARAVFTF